MRRSWIQVIVSILIATPFVFAWAYIRPADPDLPTLLVIGLAGGSLAIGSFWVAGLIMDMVASRRSNRPQG